MLAMMNDKPTVLEPRRQKLLTRWAILKAMVIDGSSKSRISFYGESERKHEATVYKPGPWDVNLLDIWPAFGEERWPPRFSFELKGTTHHIAGLINRWKIGTDITK
jgi:hypothetical protein